MTYARIIHLCYAWFCLLFISAMTMLCWFFPYAMSGDGNTWVYFTYLLFIPCWIMMMLPAWHNMRKHLRKGLGK